MAERLTDKTVRELPAPPKGNKVYYDNEARGLGLRVTSAGSRVFVFNYRTKVGVERRITIGEAGRWEDGKWQPGAWTLKDARKRAVALRQQVDAGGDPMGDLHADRAAPTVADLADRFEAEHLPQRRPATQTDYVGILRLHIRPRLGRVRVADLDYNDIEKMHAAIKKTAPYRANRTVDVLSKMLALAVRWKMRSDNPARGIERAQEEKRARFLTPAEISRLADALAAHPERTSADAIRLLLLTGARRGETLKATWEQFDLGAGVWTKPSAHTKQGKEHRIPLAAPALALLTEMRAAADQENAKRALHKMPPIPYVFPGADGKPLMEIKRTWASVCRKAGITGARVHDLRHTFASVLASSGLSLPIIGALLGHTQAATTNRYAHLMDDPLRAATERAGAIITGAGKPGADVVTLPARRA